MSLLFPLFILFALEIFIFVAISGIFLLSLSLFCKLHCVICLALTDKWLRNYLNISSSSDWTHAPGTWRSVLQHATIWQRGLSLAMRCMHTMQKGRDHKGYWQEDCIYTSEVTKSKKRQVLGCQSAGQFLSGQIIVLLLARKYGDPAKSKWSHLASSSESYLTGLIRARRQIYVLRAVHDHRLIWKEARDCWKRNKDLTINTSGTELHCCLWHGILFCAIKSLQHDFSHLLIRIFIFLASYVPKFLGIRAKI